MTGRKPSLKVGTPMRVWFAIGLRPHTNSAGSKARNVVQPFLALPGITVTKDIARSSVANG